jgi:hypothetical protein
MTKDTESGPRKTHPGLQLDMPGATSAWYEIPNFPGLYHKDYPTPVGGIGEATEQQAKDAAANESMPLKTVRIPDSMLDRRRSEAMEARRLEAGFPSREEEE